ETEWARGGAANAHRRVRRLEQEEESHRHAVARGQEHQRAQHEQLVGERVEERAQDRLLPAPAREPAVEEVGDPAEHEDERRGEGQRAAVVVDEREDDRQGGDAPEREQVRGIGDLVGQGAVFLLHPDGSSTRTPPPPAHSTRGAPASVTRRGTTLPLHPISASGATASGRRSRISMAMDGRLVWIATQPSPRSCSTASALPGTWPFSHASRSSNAWTTCSRR